MRIPKYRQQLPQKIGFVEFQGKRYYFSGRYNSDESLEKYQAFLRVNCFGQAAPDKPKTGMISVAEMVAQYLDYAKVYYPAGRSEYENIRVVLIPFVEKHLEDDAATFGPKKLKAYRDSLADGSITRSYLNGITKRIRRAFRWAVSEELIPSSVIHGLDAIGPLREGRSEARESEPREPVEQQHIDAVLPYLEQPYHDMLILQRLSGVRSGSLIKAQPEQFEKEGDLLIWRPRFKRERIIKKTAKKKLANKLIVPLGPKAQKLLKPYLARKKPGEYLFSPQDFSDSSRVGEYYGADSYRKGISRAINRANKVIKKENAKRPKKSQLPLVPYWTPHQVRHAKGDAVRELFGLEAAQAVLGHENIETTEIYAKKRLELAKKVQRQTG